MNKHTLVYNYIINDDINAFKRYLIEEEEYFQEDFPTLLSLACLYDNFSIVQILVEKINQCNKQVNNKQHNQQQLTNQPSVIDINNINDYDYFLANIIRNENLDMLKYLVEHGLDIYKKRDTLSYNPLVLAASVGNLSIVQYLVENNVSIEQWGYVALQAAANTLQPSSKHHDVIRYLIDQGASVNDNVYISKSVSPLVSFIKINDQPIVKLFIEKGADVNVDYGQPLKAACEKDNIDIVKVLIDHGADINLDKANALQTAITKGNIGILRYCFRQKSIEHSQKYSKDNKQYNKNNKKENKDKNSSNALTQENLFICLKTAIHHIYDYRLNAKNFYYKNAATNICALLIEQGADFHQQEEYCLNICCQHENKDMAAYLLQKGSTPSFIYDNPNVSTEMKRWLKQYYEEHIVTKLAQGLEKKLSNSTGNSHKNHKMKL